MYESAAACCVLWSAFSFHFHFDTRFVEVLSSLSLPFIVRILHNLGQSAKAAVYKSSEKLRSGIPKFPFLSTIQQTLGHGSKTFQVVK